MNLHDIKGMDKDDVLGLMGLQTKRSNAGRLFGTLGTFGIGLLLGAGVALLLAPRTGSELRHGIRSKIRRDRKHVEANGSEAASSGKTSSRGAS